ncbi:MAG: peroxiredoxin [Methylophilaceae bacterium]|nr:peroxiredoxin [Methylophilaceae bacterium]
MKRIILSLLLSSAIAMPAAAALKEGDSVAEFKAEASLGGKAFTYALKDTLKKGPVVVYFYPTAYGGGCSIQAHAFAEQHEKFIAAGATIVGVSLDDIGRLNQFSADPDFCASKFPVASDTDGKIAKSFDLAVNESTRGRKDKRGVVVEHGSVDRTTFIVAPDGKVFATVGGLAPALNVDKALESVQKLAALKQLNQK